MPRQMIGHCGARFLWNSLLNNAASSITMAIDKKELSKLDPQDRIKKLKEIEEQNKEEIAEIEKLIDENKSEIEQDIVEKRAVIPEAKEINIDELFESPVSRLEKTASEALSDEEEQKITYEFAQAYEILKDTAYGDDEGKKDLLQKVDRIGERLEKAKYMSISEEASKMLTASQGVIYKIRKMAGLEHAGKRYS